MSRKETLQWSRPIHQSQSATFIQTMSSPVGTLTLVATDEGLAGILWENDWPKRVQLRVETRDDSHPVLIETERQLNEYFSGRRTEFALKLDVDGTPFQRKVWNALRTIPFGETRSYGDIAKQIGNPGAMRAVGAANGRNPGVDRGALPSGHRLERQADGLRRRA